MKSAPQSPGIHDIRSASESLCYEEQKEMRGQHPSLSGYRGSSRSPASAAVASTSVPCLRVSPPPAGLFLQPVVSELQTSHISCRPEPSSSFNFFGLFFFFFFFFTAPHGLWGLSSPTRDGTVKAQGPNHWSTREFPRTLVLGGPQMFQTQHCQS